jgi:hypothetical protein
VLHEFQDFFSINTLYLEFLYTPIFLNEHNTTREKKTNKNGESFFEVGVGVCFGIFHDL